MILGLESIYFVWISCQSLKIMPSFEDKGFYRYQFASQRDF